MTYITSMRSGGQYCQWCSSLSGFSMLQARVLERSELAQGSYQGLSDSGTGPFPWVVPSRDDLTRRSHFFSRWLPEKC